MDFHESVDSFDEDDLSLVAPHRRAEVRRRLRAVKRYDAESTRAVGEAAAAELGISLDTLYVMVRAWRRTGRAEALLGSGRPKKRRNELSTVQAQVIADAIRGGDGELEDIIDKAVEIARGRGIDLFGRQVLRKHVRAALGPHVPASSFAYGARYAIDHVAVDLPVLFGDGTVAMPIVTMLIDLKKPAVLSVELHPRHPEMAATAWTVVAAMKSGLPQTGDALAYEQYPGEDWTRLAGAMRDLGIDLRVTELPKPGRSSIALHMLGDRYRGFWIKPRATLKPTAERVSRLLPGKVALDRNEAEDMLRERWVDVPSDFRPKTAREAIVIDRLRELPVNRALYA